MAGGTNLLTLTVHAWGLTSVETREEKEEYS